MFLIYHQTSRFGGPRLCSINTFNLLSDHMGDHKVQYSNCQDALPEESEDENDESITTEPKIHVTYWDWIIAKKRIRKWMNDKTDIFDNVTKNFPSKSNI